MLGPLNPKNMTSKQKKFYVAGSLLFIIIVAAVIYFSMFGDYFLKPTQFKSMVAKSEIKKGQEVKIGGDKVKGSVKKDSKGMTFQISDGKGNLEVFVPKGVDIPDTFSTGTQVVVTGDYNGGSVFKATKLEAKCPSKYVASTNKK